MDGLLLPWANTSRRQVKPDAGPVQIWGPVVNSPTFGTEQRPESARIPEEGDSECSLIYGQCVSQDQRTLGTYSKCFLNIQREMLPSPQIWLHSVCEIAQFITPHARHKRIKASGDTRKAYQPRCNLCSASSRVASSDALSISRSRLEDLRHPVPDIFNAVFFSASPSILNQAIANFSLLSSSYGTLPLIFEYLDSLITQETRSYFLNEVDGSESNDCILMIGSINNLSKFDPSLSKRLSRFDHKYHSKLPNEDERTAYCQF
jgi:SpoVK/Ycf46/Vps4 family AAA+-type ATPase